MQRAVFITVEHQEPCWIVKADTITARPEHTTRTETATALNIALLQLGGHRQIRFNSFTGPVYFILNDIQTEHRAHELAAALHVALYGELTP
ncbi:hypothetical protein [Streptomyces sp. NPDC058664]|uniref:hypothetical protein n=1 Tax=unclassified Streptomyces TaxID=2593676 RepID=UPI0036486AE7